MKTPIVPTKAKPRRANADHTTNAACLFLSPSAFADKAGFHRESIRRLIREDRLRAVKFGRNWRIPATELSKTFDEGIPARSR